MLSSVNNNLLISGVAGKLNEELTDSRSAIRSRRPKSGLILSNASHAQQISELLGLRDINCAMSKIQSAEEAVLSLQTNLKSMQNVIKQESSLGGTIAEHIKEKLLQLNKQIGNSINLIDCNDLGKFLQEAPIQAYIGRGFFLDLKTSDLSFDFKRFLKEAQDAKIEVERNQQRLEKHREMLGLAKSAFNAAIQSFKQYQIEDEKLESTGSAEKVVKNVIKQIAEESWMTSKSHSFIQADSVVKLTEL